MDQIHLASDLWMVVVLRLSENVSHRRLLPQCARHTARLRIVSQLVEEGIARLTRSVHRSEPAIVLGNVSISATAVVSVDDRF